MKPTYVVWPLAWQTPRWASLYDALTPYHEDLCGALQCLLLNVTPHTPTDAAIRRYLSDLQQRPHAPTTPTTHLVEPLGRLVDDVVRPLQALTIPTDPTWIPYYHYPHYHTTATVAVEVSYEHRDDAPPTDASDTPYPTA